MARIIIPSQTNFSIRCVCFTLCYIQYSWTSFSPHQTSSSLLSQHHHYQQNPLYHLELPRHSTLHSIFMDLSLEKDIIFSLNTNVKCFANLQHFFLQTTLRVVVFVMAGNFIFTFRKQGNVKITMILAHLCNKKR